MANIPRIGDFVIVLDSLDETFDRSKINMKGHVEGYVVEGGTGETAEDPLIEVRFEDGSVESFWIEELQVLEAGR